MNKHEFKQWWNDFSGQFPATRHWVISHGGPELLERWFGVLGRIEFSDAIAANKRLATGQEEKPEAYDREDTPAFVLRAANRVAHERQQEQQRQYRESEGFNRSSGIFPASRMMGAIREALAAGQPIEVAKAAGRKVLDDALSATMESKE